MKEKFKRTIALLMALTVLISTSGFARFEHTCKFTQIKSITFKEDGHCCQKTEITAEENGLGINQGECCDIHKDFVSLQSNSESVHSLKFSNPVFVAFVNIPAIFDICPRISSQNNFFSNTSNKAPPFAGRLLLNFIKNYRI